MDMDLIEELRKRDELLAGYLKQIEIQEEFIQKQKELIEYLTCYNKRRIRTNRKLRRHRQRQCQLPQGVLEVPASS